MFLAKKFPLQQRGTSKIFTNRRQNVNISCQTDDPEATVNLYSDVGNGPELVKNEIGDRLEQIGQIFTIYNITTHEQRRYICSATKNGISITLEKGYIIVNSGKTHCLNFQISGLFPGL